MIILCALECNHLLQGIAMSIKKFRIKKGFSFTTVSTKVVQNLKNYEALGLYTYLVSLPEDWIFYKDHLKEHAGIGRDKLNKLLRLLQAHNLIEYQQNRSPSGQFTQFDLHVKDGLDFISLDISVPKPKSKTPLTEKPLTENQLLVNSTYKRNKDKRNNNTKEIFKSSEKRSTRRSYVSDSFTPNEKHVSLANDLNLNVETEREQFVDYYKSHGKVMSDWNSAFSNWLRKASEFNHRYVKHEHPVTASIRELKEDMRKAEFQKFLN